MKSGYTLFNCQGEKQWPNLDNLVITMEWDRERLVPNGKLRETGLSSTYVHIPGLYFMILCAQA